MGEHKLNDARRRIVRVDVYLPDGKLSIPADKILTTNAAPGMLAVQAKGDKPGDMVNYFGFPFSVITEETLISPVRLT